MTDSGWKHWPAVTLVLCINRTDYTITHIQKELNDDALCTWLWNVCLTSLMDFSNASGGTWRYTAVWLSERSDSSRSPWFIKLRFLTYKCTEQNVKVLISPHYASVNHSSDVTVNRTELVLSFMPLRALFGLSGSLVFFGDSLLDHIVLLNNILITLYRSNNNKII